MKRKRRRRLRKSPVLWLLVFVNVLVAAGASRLTAVQRVDVQGVRDYDAPRVRVILDELRGVPFVRINRARIETDVLREPSVRDARLTAGPFGRAVLRVTYRRPVARLVGFANMALDDEGVIFAAPDLPRGLVPLNLAAGLPPTLVGLAANWPPGQLAQLAVDVRTFDRFGSVGIQMDAEGAIWLNVGAGHVRLGSCENLDRQLDVLLHRLLKHPDELLKIERLDLSDPERPAIVKFPVDRS